MNSRESEIRWLILNQQEPLVFKNFLHWSVLKWDLHRWEIELGEQEMEFRCGKFESTFDPQWERATETVIGSFQDFLIFQRDNDDKWIYFDYKYLRDHFEQSKDLQDSVTWNHFGFPELSSKDSTLWIGSKGAHTPCHVDTYGCNLIAQIYGTKRWIVFPPHENLLPTRIPYEESSVYSKLNLFSPNVDKFKDVRKCMSIILQPGEVLFLPHGWWHYVENLETAISINVWIPLPIDKEKQLEESLVQTVISQFVRDLNEELRNTILNPNPENKLLHQRNFMENVSVVNCCAESCRDTKEKLKAKRHIPSTSKSVNTDGVVDSFGRTIARIPYLSETEFHNLLGTQSARFHRTTNLENTTDDSLNKVSDVISAFTDGDVINLIKNKILRR